MKNNRLVLLFISFLMSGLFSVKADVKSIRFVDQNGNPLNNLVVEVAVNDQQTSLPESKKAIKHSTKSHVMDQIDKEFKPEFLLIKQGDDVAFPNSDNIRHHVYSFSAAKPFELKLYSGRPSNPITFPQHGVVTLGCNIHDSMVGFIYVAKSPHSFLTDANGRVEITTSQSIVGLTAWHPQQKLSPELPQQLDVDLLQASEDASITIETISPPARDTFGAKFKDAK